MITLSLPALQSATVNQSKSRLLNHLFVILGCIILLSGCLRTTRWPQGRFNPENFTGHPVTFGFLGEFAANQKLKAPRGISVDFSGSVYVCDTGNHRVLRLSPEGELLGEVGGFGSGVEQFNQPTDVSAKSSLDVFVVDALNSRITRFDTNLNYVGKVGFMGAFGQVTQSIGKFYGITVSETGDIYISDVERNRVIGVDIFGRNIRVFGDERAGRGRLLFPMGLDVDRDNRVYVVDAGMDQVVLFDEFGGLLKNFGRDWLKSPTGLELDRKENVFVVDTGHNRVVCFSPSGMPVGETQGDEKGFENPTDLAVTYTGELYVTDTGKNRILKFKIYY